MKARDYETLIGELMCRLAAQDLVSAPSVTHLAKFQGKSGQVYEIDISYTFRVAGADYLTLIECKYWNRKVGRSVISELSAVIEDVGAHKGIVVSTVGFQKGAIGLAVKNGIALFKVSDTEAPELHAYENLLGKTYEYVDYLMRRTERYRSGDVREVVGLAFSKLNIFEYIAQRYGEEAAFFIAEKMKPEELPPSEFTSRLFESVMNVTWGWMDDYFDLEACGLPWFIVTPETELRIINLWMMGLKKHVDELPKIYSNNT